MLTFRCKAIAVLSALLLTATAQAETIVIKNDRGGRLKPYVLRAQEWRAQGQYVEISGKCHSACTAYLASETTCVRKDAELGFHTAGDGTPEEIRYSNEFMMRLYPETIRNWIIAHGGLTKKMIYIKGKENLRKVGVLCPSKLTSAPHAEPAPQSVVTPSQEGCASRSDPSTALPLGICRRSNVNLHRLEP